MRRMNDHPGTSRATATARIALSTLLFLLAGMFTLPARAQLLPQSGSGETLTVSVLTFGPGEIYWERFGHNAILIRDSANGEAIAYNYGIFDFNQKNFMLNFARGYMQYRMAADELEYDLDIYRREGRWVQEQQLNLTPPQRAALRDYLEWNARPENRNYRYDYFTSNCSTKVRDALDQVLGGTLRRQLEAFPTRYSYRYDAVRLISPDLAAGIGMDLALGPKADQPLSLSQESFVPMVLMRALRVMKNSEGQPLVSSDTRLLQAVVPDDPPQPPDRRLSFGLAGLALAAVLLLLHQLRRAAPARWIFATLAVLYTLTCSLAGLILLALWTLTEHWAGWRNENLLLLNPLCLLLLPAWSGAFRAGWRPRAWSHRLAQGVAVIAALALLVRLGPGLYQANLPWILLLLPAHLALAWCLGHAGRRTP
jgi:hypothetical protein